MWFLYSLLVIVYMEDPICSSDIKGWQKLQTKFKDSKVKFGSRKVYCNLESARKLREEASKETMPDRKPEEIEEMNRNRLFLHYAYLPTYELGTFSNLVKFANYLQDKVLLDRYI